VSGWLIFSLLAAGFVLGWFGGSARGFYLGQRVERKRIAKLIANKTAMEVVTQLIETGTIKPTKKKKAKPRQVWPPRDETRH